MRICIILPKGLPVPAVKGGAIESLMSNIILTNEQYKLLDITVASVYDEKAYNESKNFNNTKFLYVKEKSLSFILTSIKVHILNLFKKNLNTYNEYVLKKIKKDNFDYIVAEDGAYFSFASYLKYFKKEQMMVHFHHVLTEKIDNRTNDVFKTIIGISNYVIDDLNKSKDNNYIVLKNGINIDNFTKEITKEEKEELRTKLGFTKDDFVVVYLGRIIKEKGVLELVKAIKKIDNKNTKLLIIGSTSFAESKTSDYLKEINEEISKDNKVVTTGFIDNKEVYKYLKASDLGVIPSICEDAATLTVVEMMAANLPIIITRSGGVVEYASNKAVVIEKDKNMIDNLSKEIIRLESDEKLRKEMSKEGLNKSKEYTLDNFYKNFVNLFKKEGE